MPIAAPIFQSARTAYDHGTGAVAKVPVFCFWKARGNRHALALLVAHRDHLQRVKEVVSELKARGNDAYRFHTTVMRPWGAFTVLPEGPGFKIKRIEVRPGAALSLQVHAHRSEHWIVVSGEARVTNGDRVYAVRANESTFISAGSRHRLENPGSGPLLVFEVQCGDYLGEDDIVRIEDRYGRDKT